MSRKLLGVMAVVMLAGLLAADSPSAAPFYVNVFGGGARFRGSDVSFMLGGSVGRPIGRFSPEASVAFSKTEGVTRMTLTGNAVFSVAPDARWTLFALGGAGVGQLFVDHNDLTRSGWRRSLLFNAGAGLRFRTSDWATVRLEARHLTHTKDGTKVGNFEGRAGIQLNFGP